MTILCFKRRNLMKPIIPTTAFPFLPRKTKFIKQTHLLAWYWTSLASFPLCVNQIGKFRILFPTRRNGGITMVGMVCLDLLIHFLPFQIFGLCSPLEANRIKPGFAIRLKFA